MTDMMVNTDGLVGPEPTPDWRRIRRVIARIRRDPGSFSMTSFGDPFHYREDGEGDGTHCGYTACIAGHTLLDAGYVMDGVGEYHLPGYPTHPVDEEKTAGDLLGLTLYQRHQIFYNMSVTTADGVRRLIRKVLGPEPRRVSQ